MTVPAYASDASLPKPSLRFRNASATTVRLRLVEEEEGSGSSFVISLPAARRSAENVPAMDGSGAWLRSG